MRPTDIVRVLTFKEGLLSRVAHDLQLRVRAFEVTRDGDTITVTVDPSNLRVDGAVKDGRLRTDILSAGDLAKIEKNMRNDVLVVRRHREIRFEATAEVNAQAVRLSGALHLGGRSAPLSITLRREAGRLRGRVQLVPTRWGVRPYRALGGTLRLQDRVIVEIDLEEAWASAA